MLTYKTSDGDMIDDIALRHYGELSPAILRAVLDANTGLAEWARLPAGVAILLPDIERPAGVKKAATLWT